MNKKIIKNPYGGFRGVLARFGKLDVALPVMCSLFLCIGMAHYTPSVEHLRKQSIAEINKVDTTAFFEDDLETVQDLQIEYKDIIKELPLRTDIVDAMKAFHKECSKLQTRDGCIKKYKKDLTKMAADIYSDEDKASAKALIKQFATDAKGDKTRTALDARYETAKAAISEFKTKAEVEKEQEIKTAVTGRWQIRGGNQYSFKLSENGTFLMPIDMNGEHGYLTGTWSVSGTTISVNITKNTVNPDYEPYSWVFNYNENESTLVGTGEFSGWTYTKY